MISLVDMSVRTKMVTIDIMGCRGRVLKTRSLQLSKTRCPSFSNRPKKIRLATPSASSSRRARSSRRVLTATLAQLVQVTQRREPLQMIRSSSRILVARPTQPRWRKTVKVFANLRSLPCRTTQGQAAQRVRSTCENKSRAHKEHLACAH